MPDSKYFGIPFASSGDRATIPEAVQPGGEISFTQGFGPDYERDPATDPLAKRIPRDQTNSYLHEITNALKFLQLYGLPEWYATDSAGTTVTYPLGARVRVATAAWLSIVANNTATPGADGTKWVLLNSAPRGDLDISVRGIQAAPPGGPSAGDRWIVGTGATGAWAGRTNQIATWFGSWNFTAPVTGLFANYFSGGVFFPLYFSGTDWVPWNPAGQQAQNFAVLADQKPVGTSAGTFTAGAWRTRDLTMVVSDPLNLVGAGKVSLAANRITLSAGVWQVVADAPSAGVNFNKCRLFNVTDNAAVLFGTTENGTTAGADDVTVYSRIDGLLTLAAPKVFELQHIGEVTGLFGQPRPAALSAVVTDPEVYSRVRVSLIKDA